MVDVDSFNGYRQRRLRNEPPEGPPRDGGEKKQYPLFKTDIDKLQADARRTIKHPIGVSGGFMDHAMSLEMPEELEVFLHAGAISLLAQSIPGLSRKDSRDPDREDRLLVEGEYVLGIMVDRKASGVKSHEPLDPHRINSEGIFTIGEVLDLVESQRLTIEARRNLFNEHARSSALLNLGFQSPRDNPQIFMNRMVTEVAYLNNAFADRKRFPL